MSRTSPVIAVDVVGGDFAPAEVLSGIEEALEDLSGTSLIALGPADIVEPLSERLPLVRAVVCPEIIAMDEHPATAVRQKRDSSITVGARLLRDGRADAFFSAGSTGAVMAAATLVTGRIRGVSRPAIATVLPTAGPPCVLLDVGANADCRPENLLQFGLMGVAYSKAVLDVESPRVGLLNIGEEPTKGSMLAIEAHALLQNGCPGFVGNVEGRDVLSGSVDVIVTDGFTGNVALKLLEGASRTLLDQVKTAMTASPLTTAAAAVLKPSLARLRERLDPDAYGGAPLLGVNGVTIIGHGSSRAKAIRNAIRVAELSVRAGLTERIAASVSIEDSQSA